jgi:hypothetical protein
MRLRVKVEIVALVAAVGSVVLSGWSLWQSSSAVRIAQREADVAHFAPAAFELDDDCSATLSAWPENVVLLDFKIFEDGADTYNFISERTESINLTGIALDDGRRRFGVELPNRSGLRTGEPDEWIWEHYYPVPLIASYKVELGGRYEEYHALVWLFVGYEFEARDDALPKSYFCRSISSAGYYSTLPEAQAAQRASVPPGDNGP